MPDSAPSLWPKKFCSWRRDALITQARPFSIGQISARDVAKAVAQDLLRGGFRRSVKYSQHGVITSAPP